MGRLGLPSAFTSSYAREGAANAAPATFPVAAKAAGASVAVQRGALFRRSEHGASLWREDASRAALPGAGGWRKGVKPTRVDVQSGHLSTGLGPFSQRFSLLTGKRSLTAMQLHADITRVTRQASAIVRPSAVTVRSSMTARLILCLLIVMLSSRPSLAAEAKAFYVAVDGASDIIVTQDHLSVSLLHGWIASKDSFFKALLSKKSKLAISIDGQVQYFDGDRSTYSKLLENTDIQKNTDRPWGAILSLIDAQPADATPSLTFKLGIYRDDRLSQLLDAAKGAEPADLTKQMDLWMGYGRLLSAVLSNIFGTANPNYPFLLTVDIKASSMITAGRLHEHYLVALAPNKDDDPFLTNVDATKLHYNEASQQLTYDGQVLLDHSYAVLKITKADAPDITKLIAESKAPWAVLAVSQFLSIPIQDVQNRDQILVLAKGLLTQLTTELDLLKNEHRFAAYDRAIALYEFATRAKSAVSSACSAHQVSAPDCPVGDLDRFIDNIKPSNSLPLTTLLPQPNKPGVDFDRLRQLLRR